MLAILAAVLLATAPQFDTVFTADGGRFIGTVIEEGPQGISVQLPDGTTRRLERKDVIRIEYRDGSVSTPSRPAPPPPAYAPPPAPPVYQPPPPAYQPPPPAYGPPPAYRPPPPPMRQPPPTYAGPGGGMPPISPVYGAVGIGGLFMSGEAEDGVDIDRIFDPQLDIFLEGGLRLNPHVALGMYLDLGVGEPSREVRNLNPICDLGDNSCTATTGRVGLLLRYTFQPRAYSTPWVSVGTGLEWGDVSLHDDMGGGNDELFSYRGWEALRFMLGVDLRANPVFGIGLYGGIGVGRYSEYEDASGTYDLDHEPFHTTVEAGLRFTLFP